ncbi:uncharacterized protein SOCE26_044330 [Sorangium cellulosum]|uniref:Secreted protein n=1 Tax=Sorangium cellulosum TaxID=56 RepID=A0A2L0EUM4_SORCE|nr:hypothetical protein [Sorangium cellulosum]AUX42993.1 uncharacterized protein SOCE26_044330 [Sorangium cellulosum]
MNLFTALCASVASALAAGCALDPGGPGDDGAEDVGSAAQALSPDGQGGLRPQTAVPSSCAHDACEAVNAEALNMTTSCGDPCVEAICAADPRCCTPFCTSTAQCQARVEAGSVCTVTGRCTLPAGATCPPGTRMQSGTCTGVWSAACVALVATHCPGKTCGGPAPTSDGAGGVQVQDWEITYSCADAE